MRPGSRATLVPDLQVMMDHALPLLERIAKPSDIAVVNFGAWHGGGEGQDFANLIQEFADAAFERAAVLPHLVWKEMVPTHYDQQHGMFPGGPPHLLQSSCCLKGPLIRRLRLRSFLHINALFLRGNLYS